MPTPESIRTENLQIYSDLIKKLEAFKTFVHRRLDAAGIPTHPEGKHAAEGCRVGERLRVFQDQRDVALVEVERMRNRAEKAEAIIREAAETISGILCWGFDGNPRTLITWCQRIAHFKADYETAKHAPAVDWKDAANAERVGLENDFNALRRDAQRCRDERDAARAELETARKARQDDTARLQQECNDWGAYWRAPDAHGVNLSVEQAVELLQDALGVEVEIMAGVAELPRLRAQVETLTKERDETRAISSFWKSHAEMELEATQSAEAEARALREQVRQGWEALLAAAGAVDRLHGLGIALSDESFTPGLRWQYRQYIHEIKAEMEHGLIMALLRGEPHSPLPTPPVADAAPDPYAYDWSSAPAWAMWAAVDDDGFAFWYTERPTNSMGVWRTGGYTGDPHCEIMGNRWNASSWQTSLRQRPAADAPKETTDGQ